MREGLKSLAIEMNFCLLTHSCVCEKDLQEHHPKKRVDNNIQLLDNLAEKYANTVL